MQLFEIHDYARRLAGAYGPQGARLAQNIRSPWLESSSATNMAFSGKTTLTR